MNQNVLLTIAASVGLVAGSGGTWYAASTSSKEIDVVSKEVIAAFIKVDPTLCVEAPTRAEALSAYRQAYAASPLVWDRDNLPEITLALGRCDRRVQVLAEHTMTADPAFPTIRVDVADLESLGPHTLAIGKAGASAFTAQIHAASRVRAEDTIQIPVDPEKMHFFLKSSVST